MIRVHGVLVSDRGDRRRAVLGVIDEWTPERLRDFASAATCSSM